MNERIQQHHSVMPIAQLPAISQIADLHCAHRTTVYDFIKNDGLPVLKLGTHPLNPWPRPSSSSGSMSAQSCLLWRRRKKGTYYATDA